MKDIPPARNEIVVPGDARPATLLALLRRRWNRLTSVITGSQFNKNMGVGSAMALVSSSLSVISYPLYLHYLGYHRFGLWLVLSVVVSVAQLGGLGIPWALTKLVAEDHGTGDWEGVRTYINTGCGIILGVGMVFFVAVILCRNSIVHWFNLGNADATTVHELLPGVAALSVLVLVFSTLNASLGGLGRMDLTSYNETITQVFSIVMSALLLHFRLDLLGVLIASLVAYGSTLLLALVSIQRVMPIPLFRLPLRDERRLSNLLRTGGWIGGAGMFTILLVPSTRLLLSRFAGLEAVTINDMCFTGSMRVRGIFEAAFRPILPDISKWNAARNSSELRHRIRSVERKAFILIAATALPTYLLLLSIMNPLLHIWLRRSFNPVLPGTFRIALIGSFISLVGVPSYYLLIGIGKARSATISAITQFSVGVSALFIVKSVAGHVTVGMAAATFGVSAACSTAYTLFSVHNLGLPEDHGVNLSMKSSVTGQNAKCKLSRDLEISTPHLPIPLDSVPYD